MNKVKDLTGQTFGELTVLERDYNYVKEHNIPATKYQDYGWPEKTLPLKENNK